MMTVSSDDGASSCRATRPRCIAKPSDPGLGRDEFVDEVFNATADLVTDGSDGNWAANPLSLESSRFTATPAGSQPIGASHDQPMSMRRTTTAAKRIRPSRVTQSCGSRGSMVASRRTGRSTRNKIGNSDTASPTVSRTAAS
jgi:hypothetical protein